MTIYVFDAHGRIEERDDTFALPEGVNMAVFGMPGAAIAEEIPDEIYENRVALYDDPIALFSPWVLTL